MAKNESEINQPEMHEIHLSDEEVVFLYQALDGATVKGLQNKSLILSVMSKLAPGIQAVQAKMRAAQQQGFVHEEKE